MPSRHSRYAQVGEYQGTNITAATDSHGVPITPLYTTTSSTTVTGGATASTITVGAAPLSGFVTVGSRLYVYSGTGTAETVTVTAINPATPSISAVFANNHSGTFTLSSVTGTKLGSIWVNAVGTTMSLVLWDGPPDLSGATPPSVKRATITPALGSYVAHGAFDRGLFIVYTGGAAGDLTFWSLPDPV